MELETQSVRRLMEIGYVAAGAGRFADADTIFLAVQAARPESELPQIGRAIVCLNAGKHVEAIALLKAALEKNPESDLAMLFLGFAFQLAGFQAAGAAALEQIVAADGKQPTAALAKSLLEA